MKAVLKKELRLYFNSPVAYVLIGLFFMVSSIIFSSSLVAGTVKYQTSLTSMGVMQIFIVPVLTMRLFAEEHKNGTTGMLLRSPLGLWKIVAAKFLSAIFVMIIMLALSLIYILLIRIFGGVVTRQIISGYIGLILLSCSFLSIGIFMSSITENQIQAAVFTIVALMITWVADQVAASLGSIIAKILSGFSFYSRFVYFTQGIFDLSSIVYFISVTVMFLTLTVVFLEKRKIDK